MTLTWLAASLGPSRKLARPPGTCSETPGRYRGITRLRRRQRPRPARLRARPAAGAGPAIRDRRAASPGTTVGGGNRRLGLALLVIATAQLMVVLDATIVNVALPHVQRALGFSGSGLEWVVNAYAVPSAGCFCSAAAPVTSLAGGGCSCSAAAVLRASLLGGFATSEWWLLTARACRELAGR